MAVVPFLVLYASSDNALSETLLCIIFLSLSRLLSSTFNFNLC